MKTKMAMENPRFEDVFPIEHGRFSIAMLVFRSVYFSLGGGELLDVMM